MPPEGYTPRADGLGKGNGVASWPDNDIRLGQAGLEVLMRTPSFQQQIPTRKSDLWHLLPIHLVVKCFDTRNYLVIGGTKVFSRS